MGRTLWILAAVLLLAGQATATPVTLYVHLNGLQYAPINTQEPVSQDALENGTNIGVMTHSGCVQDPTGIQTFTSRSQHTWHGYMTPGPVEYDDRSGRQLVTHHVGNPLPIQFDPSAPIRFQYALLATHDVTISSATSPPVVPEMELHFTLRQGSDVGAGREALDQGTLLAEAVAGPVTLHPDLDHPQVSHHSTPAGDVYLFEVEAPVREATIPEEIGFNLRVDAIMDNPYCEDKEEGGYVSPDLVRPYMDADLRPAIHVEVLRGLQFQKTQTFHVGDELVFPMLAQSPFGFHDVRATPETVRVTGPEGPVALRAIKMDFNDHHGPPPNGIPYVWVMENISTYPHGQYHVTYAASNLQNTTSFAAYGSIEIGPEIRYCYPTEAGPVCQSTRTVQKSPAVAPLVLGISLLAGAFLLRRQAGRERL